MRLMASLGRLTQIIRKIPSIVETRIQEYIKPQQHSQNLTTLKWKRSNQLFNPQNQETKLKDLKVVYKDQLKILLLRKMKNS